MPRKDGVSFGNALFFIGLPPLDIGRAVRRVIAGGEDDKFVPAIRKALTVS